MSFTPADVIEELREAVSDTEATPYRYSDAFILRRVNQSLKRLAIVRPDLFTEIATITCVAGSMQSAPADSLRLMDVLANTAGTAVKEINQDVLDLMFPTWESGATAAAVNWMRYTRDPNRFYVYPPATTSDTLQLLYCQSPPNYAVGDTIALQDAYFPLILDCTIWLVESIDAEHVDSGRAKMFKDSFIEMAAAGLQARKITDTDAAGMAPNEVL